ncbi:hypothetical protein PoB_007708400 [Plakobranchus ocellatus]|uniref:Uncharacterized protein n=1 Tax=Plakobranchus ocellatus TaxID=259542 RepID=A0AAV4E2Z1_9GAST|nr:hypothetical protein PoB_007708400 [Plakobranchus ocellatus]
MLLHTALKKSVVIDKVTCTKLCKKILLVEQKASFSRQFSQGHDVSTLTRGKKTPAMSDQALADRRSCHPEIFSLFTSVLPFPFSSPLPNHIELLILIQQSETNLRISTVIFSSYILFIYLEKLKFFDFKHSQSPFLSGPELDSASIVDRSATSGEKSRVTEEGI